MQRFLYTDEHYDFFRRQFGRFVRTVNVIARTLNTLCFNERPEKLTDVH